MGNVSDSHVLCWEAALLIGSFMLQASSAISPVQGAMLGTADRQVKPGVFCVLGRQSPRLEVLAEGGTHTGANGHWLAESAVPPGVLAHPCVEGSACTGVTKAWDPR